MTVTEYGVRHVHDVDLTTDWYRSRAEAQAAVERGDRIRPRKLVAREVGEVFDVKVLPTEPGSVILCEVYTDGVIRQLMLTEDEFDQWVVVPRPADGPRWIDTKLLVETDWTLIHDAGAIE